LVKHLTSHHHRTLHSDDKLPNKTKPKPSQFNKILIIFGPTINNITETANIKTNFKKQANPQITRCLFILVPVEEILFCIRNVSISF
jgi:hypothetical protein